MADNLEAQQYRALLVQTWQKTQDDIDKAILSLSGGALGVSFVFLKDIVGPTGAHRPGLPFFGLGGLGRQLRPNASFFFTSRHAFAKQIKLLNDEIAGRVSQPSPRSGRLRRLAGGALVLLD